MAVSCNPASLPISKILLYSQLTGMSITNGKSIFSQGCMSFLAKSCNSSQSLTVSSIPWKSFTWVYIIPGITGVYIIPGKSLFPQWCILFLVERSSLAALPLNLKKPYWKASLGVRGVYYSWKKKKLGCLLCLANTALLPTVSFTPGKSLLSLISSFWTAADISGSHLCRRGLAA